MRGNNRRLGGYTLAETLMIGFLVLAAIIVVIAVIAVIANILPNYSYIHNGHGSQNACINNLRIIDGAKSQWAIENKKESTDTPAASDIQPYMGHGATGELPVCPNDRKQTFATSYSPNNVGTKPVCKIMPTNHVLP